MGVIIPYMGVWVRSSHNNSETIAEPRLRSYCAMSHSSGSQWQLALITGNILLPVCMCLCWLQTVPTVCHLLINGLLARPKCIGSRDWSCVRTRDESGDLLVVWSHETRSPDGLAHVPCFSGSCVGLIMGFTCGTFDLELVMLDVVDCVHNTAGSLQWK